MRCRVWWGNDYGYEQRTQFYADTSDDCQAHTKSLRHPKCHPRLRELIADLERAGFLDRGGGKGSHGKFVHPNSERPVIVLVPSSNRISGISSTSGHEIAKYVIAAVQAISKKEHLQLKKSTISAGLKVKITKGGGVSVELVGISIEGSKTFSSTTGHQLKLVFAHPEEKKIEP